MQEGSREILQRLMYHAHRDDFDAYLKYFDENERTKLSSITKIEEPLAFHVDPVIETLHRFHYSWYLDLLSKCPKSFQKQILVIFSEEQQKKIQGKLQIKSLSKPASELIQKFFTQKLLKEIGYNVLLPTCFFSHSNCMFLMQIEKKQLVKLMHKLGVIDIANMSKKIVDKSTLKELSKFLSSEQKKLFKEVQKKYNDPLSSSVKDLHKHLEDDRSFSHFLEKRGIARFAMGMANENSFLCWHIAHILDKGRGQEFLNVVRRCVPNQHTAYYNKQIIDNCKSSKESKASS